MLKKILLLIALLTSSLFPQSNLKEVRYKIDTVLSNKYFNSTLMGIDVYDLSARQSIYKKNEKMLLNPASNMKILTTSTALVFLGPTYSFTTSLYYSGKIINKTLYGDLYVVGGSDPDFTTEDIDSLVSVIKSLGIKEITGNIYGDVSMMDSLFWGRGWMWDDDPSTDAPYLTPLDINRNSIGIIVKSKLLGEKPSVSLVPPTDYVSIQNKAITVPADSPSTLKVTRAWLNRKNKIIVEGNLPDKIIPDSLQDTLYVNVFKPDFYFLTLLKEHAVNSGIIFDGKIDTATTPFSAINFFNFKRPFDSVIVNLNKVSYNLGAEMTMYAFSRKFYGKPATAQNGMKVIDSLLVLAGLTPDNYRIVDGSGVSRYDLVTAKVLLSVLKYMYYKKPSLFRILYKSFPIAGVDGTLKNRMKNTPAEGNVHAKTGTLSGVCSLSGYLTAKNGHLIVFSMLTENFVGSAKKGRNFQDEISNILVNYN